MNILIVDSDIFFGKLIFSYIKKFIIFSKSTFVSSFYELKNIDLSRYDIIVTDYILFDSEGEHIEFLIKNNKKVIIFSKYDFFDMKINKEKIINYIPKSYPNALNSLIKFLKRLYKNKSKRVLLIEENKDLRLFEKNVLEGINLNIIESSNSKEGLELINSSNLIDLVIVDYDISFLYIDRFLIEVRNIKSIEDLPIIVTCSKKDSYKLMKLFNYQINDFLIKPFLKEELIIRVNNILELNESVTALYKSLEKDSLTNLYNRHFIEYSLDSLFKIYPTKSIVMLDIDKFKLINDTYGHQIGDEILKHFATVLKDKVRKSDFIVRYGGEEFLIFMPNTSKEEAIQVIEKIRNSLPSFNNIKYTFSAGVADEGDNLAEMINIADSRLYRAKQSGRNKVIA